MSWLHVELRDVALYHAPIGMKGSPARGELGWYVFTRAHRTFPMAGRTAASRVATRSPLSAVGAAQSAACHALRDAAGDLHIGD